MQTKTALVVNLFGGPGTGKSTGASYIFSKLKMMGINAELITEFAKDKIYENNKEALSNQTYVLGEQSLKISRCYNKVDVIITDAPLVLSIEYGKDLEESEEIKKLAIKLHNKYNHIDIFLNRIKSKSYNNDGRLQTKEEAEAIDLRLINLLDEIHSEDHEIYLCDADIDGYEYIIKIILEKLNIINERIVK